LKQKKAEKEFLRLGQKGAEYLLVKKQTVKDEDLLWRIDAILSKISR